MKIYKKSMLIEESDNVAVAVEPIQAGECTLVAGEEITAVVNLLEKRFVRWRGES